MEKETFKKQLGKRVATIREEQNISQSQLAMRVEKSRQSINRLESGLVNPTVYFLKEIARALNRSLSDILNL